MSACFCVGCTSASLCTGPSRTAPQDSKHTEAAMVKWSARNAILAAACGAASHCVDWGFCTCVKSCAPGTRGAAAAARRMNAAAAARLRPVALGSALSPPAPHVPFESPPCLHWHKSLTTLNSLHQCSFFHFLALHAGICFARQEHQGVDFCMLFVDVQHDCLRSSCVV